MGLRKLNPVLQDRLSTLLRVLCYTECSFGLVIITLSVIPLSVIFTYLAGLQLYLKMVFLTQLMCGTSVALTSLSGAILSGSFVEQEFLISSKRGYLFWTLLSSLITLLVTVTMFILPSAVNIGMDELSDALLTSMRKYLLDSRWKTLFDEIQQGLHCCGLNSYEDWLKTNWIPVQSIRTDLDPVNSPLGEDGGLLVPILPHSCCNPEVNIPCLHDTLQQNETIRLWAAGGAVVLFKDSLYTSGCQKILNKIMNNGLISFNVLTSLIITLQVGILILAKYLVRLSTGKVKENVEQQEQEHLLDEFVPT